MISPTPTLIAVNGARISVTRHGGTGPEMLLIHGIGSSGADFDPVIEGLKAFCQPITFDLRGHGESSRPDSGYHYLDYVHDLDGLIPPLKLQRPIVLGHSLGGIITLFWAAQHPETAAGIIIEDSPLRSGEEFRDAFEGWLTLNALPVDQVRAWYASKNPSWSDAVLDQRAIDMTRTSRTAIEELMAASMSGDGLDTSIDLGTIPVPMLFIHGDAESGSMVHPDDLATLPDGIAGMRLTRVPGAGHTIHRSHIDTWLNLVRSFVEGLGI